MLKDIRESATLKVVGALLSICLAVGGVIFGMETRYSKAADTQQIQQTLSVHKLEHREQRLVERVWTLEKEYGFDANKWPDKYKSEYNEIKLELERVKREIKSYLKDK